MNVDLRPKFYILDLCAGFGMLAEATRIALDTIGYRSRVVCHVERDSAAAASLVARMEAAPVDRAPVWDDLATFDGRRWRGVVDLLCAGLPCQPYSLAGKRLGNIDQRSHGEDGDGPIVHFLRIVEECRPALVFLENVSAWVVGGHFRSVGEELCRLGYTLESPVFLAASDVGAPHERERVFVLAHRAGERRHGDAQRDVGTLQPEQRAPRRGDDERCGADVAHAQRDGRRFDEQGRGSDRGGVDRRHRSQLALSASGGLRARGEPSGRDGLADRGVEELADDIDGRRGWIDIEELGDSSSIRSERVRTEDTARSGGMCNAGEPVGELGDARRGGLGGPQAFQDGEEPGVGRDAERSIGDLPLFPPGRGDPDDPDLPDWWAWAAVAAVDATLLPRVEPTLSMVAHGMAPADLLRIGGNGVVPLAAACAFRALWADAFGLGGEE